MTAWRRAHLTKHWKSWDTRGTESFWILGFLSDQDGLSAHWSHDTWPNTWTCEVVRCWGFKCWTSHALYSNCYWLGVRVVRCCSHLTRPCVVFHRWVGKTCGTLIDQSHDAWPESGDTTGAMTSIRVRKCDQSWDIRPELRYTTGVASSDQSHVFRPESRIRPELRLLTRVRHTTEVTSFDRSHSYDWCREIPTS
jgi:hypothetical protein